MRLIGILGGVVSGFLKAVLLGIAAFVLLLWLFHLLS